MDRQPTAVLFQSTDFEPEHMAAGRQITTLKDQSIGNHAPLFMHHTALKIEEAQDTYLPARVREPEMDTFLEGVREDLHRVRSGGRAAQDPG